MEIIASLLAACIDVFLLSHVISRPIEVFNNLIRLLAMY
jgi:hypothetical protein